MPRKKKAESTAAPRVAPAGKTQVSFYLPTDLYSLVGQAADAFVDVSRTQIIVAALELVAAGPGGLTAAYVQAGARRAAIALRPAEPAPSEGPAMHGGDEPATEATP